MSAPESNNSGQAGDDIAFDNLCDLCMDMFNHNATWNPNIYSSRETDYRAHHDIRALARSAEANCHLCSLILVRIVPADIERLQKDLDESVVVPSQQIWIRIKLYGDEYTLEVTARGSPILQNTDGLDDNEDSSSQGRRSKIASLTILPTELDYMSDMRSKSTLNFSDRMFIQIAQWMEVCLRSHSKCFGIQTVAATRDILPTRLLDLVPIPHGNTIRLKSSKSLPLDTIYATLSHCWGGRCRVTLTEGSLAGFQAGILVTVLPRTFQDAVLVTRKLGVRYLWIDSLCIIQDSAQDWRYEASIMGDIYANSYVTIAATASSDSEGGLFYSRSPLSVWPCKLKATWDCFTAGNLAAGVTGWAEERHMEPLGSRGWVFQEWLLSKRIIHFSKDQIRWECFCLAASEAYPTGLNETDLEYHGTPTKSIIALLIEEAEPEILWQRIRQEYSEKRLTVATDKLAAFSGIVRMIHKLLKCTKEDYLAGLWKPKLLEELLWERYEKEGYRSQSSLYIAPTWSWASLDSSFWYPGLLESTDHPWKFHAKVLDTKTFPRDDDFGPITGGSLTIQCSLFFIVVTSPQNNSSRWWKLSSINGTSMPFDCKISLDKATTFAPSTRCSFYFTPIRSMDSISSGGWDITGLLVEETTEGHGQYYRLGLMKIFGAQKEAIVSYLNGRTCLDSSSYKDLSTTGLYSIELI